MNRLRSCLLLAAVLSLAPQLAAAGPGTCLTGSEPAVAGDAAKITATRQLIDERCVCAAFDGSKGKRHSDYVKCALAVVDERIVAGELRKECKTTVKKMHAKSTCGYDAALGSVACVTIKMRAKGPSVRCDIKATRKLDGTPVDKCPTTSRCSTTFSHCIDAADTNGDLLIAAPGDTGSCEPEPVSLRGRCLRPGPLGMRSCDRGTLVRALRCNDPATCLSLETAATEVANGPVDTVGEFSMLARRRAVECRNVLFKAEVASGVAYRTSQEAPCSTARSARALAEPDTIDLGDVVIDPGSEGAVRAIEAAGLETAQPDDLTDLPVQTRTAPGAAFAGLDDAAAADLAEDLAFGLYSVQPQVVVANAAGDYLYVRSGLDRSLSVLQRNATTGALRFVQSLRDDVGGADGLKGQGGISVSPDGTTVYTAAFEENEVSAYAVDPSTGRLSLIDLEKQGVAGVTGLTLVVDVAVSPDGAHVYATAFNQLVAFARDPGTGTLSFLQNLTQGSSGVDGLAGATALALSPDGTRLYVAATEHSLATYARNPASGLLTHVETRRDGVGGVDGLRGARDVAVSGDGTRVYVAASVDGAVSVFAPNSGTGGLDYIEAQFNGGGVLGLTGAFNVVASVDGEHVYVGGLGEGRVAIFERDTNTGGLAFVTAINRDEARSLALSPDGAHLYIAASLYSSIPIFARDEATGLLTDVGSSRAFLRRSALRGATEVAVSADVAHVYASARNDDAVSAFTRDSQTGKLRLVDVRRNGAAGLSGLQQPMGVALSPDDAHLYATSQYVGEVTTFARDLADGTLGLAQQIKASSLAELVTAQKAIVSPDGAHVYVGTQSGTPAIVVFSRNPVTGALTWVETVSGVTGLSGPNGFAFSPDGVHLYVANIGNGAKTLVFGRDAMTGALTWMQSNRARGRDVAMSSDAAFVYVASDDLEVFSRNPSTGELTLVELQSFLNGVSGAPMAATTVALSPDDAHVYVASQQNAGLSVFSRNPTTGQVTFVESHFDGVQGVDGLEGELRADVSADGEHLYVSSLDDDAIAVFDRDATTGALSFVQAKR